MRKGKTETSQHIYTHRVSEWMNKCVGCWIVCTSLSIFCAHTHLGASAILWKFIQVKSLKSSKLFEFMDSVFRGLKWADGDNSTTEMYTIHTEYTYLLYIYTRRTSAIFCLFLMVGGDLQKVFAIKLLITSKTSETKRRRHANCAS